MKKRCLDQIERSKSAIFDQGFLVQVECTGESDP